MFNVIFFLLPFLFYIGIVAQGVSFYLLCILLPTLLCFKQQKVIPRFFSTIALCLIVLHILFPIANFINDIFRDPTVPQSIYTIELTWPGILKSGFPSSFLFGGILVLLLTYFRSRSPAQKLTHIEYTDKPLHSFLLGLLPASILFCLLMLYQHYTGIDLRTHEKFGTLMTNDNLLSTGGFRVYGFFGHPLTVAGVGLAYAAFVWTLLWQFISKKYYVNFDYIPYAAKKYIPELFLGTIAIANALLVFLSAGRTAAVVCIAIFVLVPLILNFKRKPFQTLAVICVTLVACFFIGQRYAIFTRIDSTLTSVVQKHSLDAGNYRQYFWKVYAQMFYQKPILGQGNYWLAQGVRENYYEKMGFGDLPEKYNAHNNYLEILGSVGILGTLIILGCLFKLWRTLKNKVLVQKYSVLLLPVLVMVLANLGHAFTQDVFFDSSVDYIYLEILFVLMWNAARTANVTTHK